MTTQPLNNPLQDRMQQLTRLLPTLALIEYDCINAHLGWTAACGSSLGIPIFQQPLPLRRWLSLFDRSTRQMMWRVCANLLAQHSRGQVLNLQVVTLADGRTTALTTQIDIGYASDQRPDRISVIVLQHNSAQATGERSAQRSHALRGPLGTIGSAVEVLLTGVGSDHVRERALQIIDRQTRKLARLVAAMDEQD